MTTPLTVFDTTKWLQRRKDGPIHPCLCDSQLDAGQQVELSQLLTLNREGKLNNVESAELGVLLQTYRRALVRKAQAWKVATSHGLNVSIN